MFSPTINSHAHTHCTTQNEANARWYEICMFVPFVAQSSKQQTRRQHCKFKQNCYGICYVSRR